MRFVFGVLLLALSITCAAAGAEKTAAASTPYGIESRTAWTTSNFRGRPEPPPPYRAERIYPQAKFNLTTVISSAPGTKRLFVGERAGKIYSLTGDPKQGTSELFLDTATLVKRLNRPDQPALDFEALYGLTFDPDFAQNRFCYVCYVVRYSDRSKGQVPDGTRVVRFKVSQSDPPVCDVDSEQLVIAWLQGGHNGGCLKFGLDGCLYISSGDGGVAFPPDGLKSGQDMTTLLAKVLRIDVRGGTAERPYTIPADNPFAKLDKARGETWCYGLRNPWKMSFDRKTGALWIGDVGWELWELVYRANKGDNFGWSIVEGSQPVHSERPRGPTPIVPATLEIPHTDGASITGGFVYRGKQFPELVGKYIFGDWETRRIWGMDVDGPQLGERFELVDPTIRIVDFAEDADGELYLHDHEDGGIYTLAKNPQTAAENKFPRKLSDTGLFNSVAKHEPAAGVIPFSINTEQWSDHATAERWLAVPGQETILIRSKPKLVPGSQFSRATDYPLDTVLIKTLSLELKAGDPSSRRRVETQALHYDGREWQGYAYEWNDEQTEAVLVDRAGKNRTFTVHDPKESKGQRTHSWRFASRNECIRCHNPWSEYTLAFNLAQINREHDYGAVRDNQIRTLRHIGMLTDAVEPPDPHDPYYKPEPIRSPEEIPRLTAPFDESADINLRARSYLHVNCGHCHRFNGGGSSYIYLQHQLPLQDMKAIGVRPTQGTFGMHNAQLIAPGDPYRSALYFRLAKTGPGHMPHLGAKIIDERALGLVHDWIRQLPVRLDDHVNIERLTQLDEATVLEKEQAELAKDEYQLARRAAQRQKREKPTEEELSTAKRQIAEQRATAATKRATDRKQIIEQLLSTPVQAAQLVGAVRQERFSTAIRAMVMERALNASTDAAIRDLFEALIPEEQRTQRLGESINPAEILKLTGDIERGRQLFHESNVVQCRSCHRIAGKGTELGPDLDAIGKKHERAKLLESILQPSLQIDPKYTLWLVETKAGIVLSGLMIERNDQGLTLRDAQNKTHRVTTAEIEGVFPQTKSLMPELMLKDFTATQAADLLAYLSTLRAP